MKESKMNEGKIEVKELEGFAVIITTEPSPGFNRGKGIEYLALLPDVAITIGERLISIGRKLKHGRD